MAGLHDFDRAGVSACDGARASLFCASDGAIRINRGELEAEVGGTSPGAIENQQLLLDEQGLGHHGTRPAGTSEPGESRQ